MARLFRRLMTGLLLMILGCAEPPEIYADAPLMVFNSYPANGATVARTDLREVAIAFTEDLGAADHARDVAGQYIALEGPDGVVSIARTDRTNIAYDADYYSVRIQLDIEVRAALSPGQYRLTAYRALETQTGTALPADFVVEFYLAVQADEEDEQ